jgi:hypothetical protein
MPCGAAASLLKRRVRERWELLWELLLDFARQRAYLRTRRSFWHRVDDEL